MHQHVHSVLQYAYHLLHSEGGLADVVGEILRTEETKTSLVVVPILERIPFGEINSIPRQIFLIPCIEFHEINQDFRQQGILILLSFEVVAKETQDHAKQQKGPHSSAVRLVQISLPQKAFHHKSQVLELWINFKDFLHFLYMFDPIKFVYRQVKLDLTFFVHELDNRNLCVPNWQQLLNILAFLQDFNNFVENGFVRDLVGLYGQVDVCLWQVKFGLKGTEVVNTYFVAYFRADHLLYLICGSLSPLMLGGRRLNIFDKSNDFVMKSDKRVTYFQNFGSEPRSDFGLIESLDFLDLLVLKELNKEFLIILFSGKDSLVFDLSLAFHYQLRIMEQGQLVKLVLYLQIIIIVVLYGVFVRYPPVSNLSSSIAEQPSHQDISFFLVVGFGLRYAWMKKYCWSTMTNSLLLFPLALLSYFLWRQLWRFVFYSNFQRFLLMGLPEITSMYKAGFACLITSAVVLGKVSLIQYIIIAIFQILFYSLNEAIQMFIVELVDNGGAQTIHVFSSVFGIAVSYFFHSPYQNSNPWRKSSHYNSWYAMAGLCLMWLFYPSFNAAGLSQKQKSISLVNSFISICGSTLMTFAVLTYKHQKINPSQFLVGSLSGAVGIAACSQLNNLPVLAFSVGVITAGITILLSPYLNQKLKNHDSSHVVMQHLIPGVLGTFLSAIVLSISVTTVPLSSSLQTQAALQIGGIFITIGIGSLGGSVVGWVLSKLTLQHYEGMVSSNVEGDSPRWCYHDRLQWHVDQASIKEQEYQQSQKHLVL